MDEIINIRAVKHYDEHRGMPTRHPYVRILEGSQVIKPIPNYRKNIRLYVIFLKDVPCALRFDDEGSTGRCGLCGRRLYKGLDLGFRAADQAGCR